jgi:hypothetical protein
MEIKDLLTSVCATLQRDSDSVASLLNEDGSIKDDAAATVNSWHAEHLKTVRERDKTGFDNGVKKAHKEFDEKYRRFAKSAFEFETDLKGEEFFDAFKEHIESKSTDNSTTLNDESVKKHPTFVARERELLKQIKEANDAKMTEVEKLQKEYSRKDALAKVSEKAIALFKSKNPILSADEAKAMKAIKSLLLDPISGYDYELNDKGEIASISKDGKRLEDGNGNPITFESLVINTAEESFEFKKIDTRSSPNGGQSGQGEGKKAVILPKNEQEYAKIISDPKIPVGEKTAVQEAWKAAQVQN